MVMLSMALLGTMFITQVAAAPIKTKASISSRVQSQTELCELGGGEIEVSYGYENGRLTSAQTVCDGGSDDGRVCSNTTTITDCYKRPGLVRPTESVVPEQRADTAAPVENRQQTTPVASDSAVPAGGVAEDPTEEQTRIVDPAEICEALGGTTNVIVQGSTVPDEIRCTGGALDDMICYGTICDYFRRSTGSEEDLNAPPTGGIVFAEPVSLDDLDYDADASVAPGMAEDPTGDETVIANQVGDPVTTGTSAAQLCGAFGGTPIVNQPRTAGTGLESVTVVCDGGMLDRMVCGHEVGSSPFCYRMRVVQGEDSRVTPGGGIEVVSEEPGNVAGDTGVTPGVAEDPTGNETLVIANQVGHPVDQAAMQSAICRLAGGKAVVSEPTRTVSHGLEANSRCEGGLLGGMLCVNNAKYSVCIFRSVPPEDLGVTSAGGIKVPAEDAEMETTVAESTVAAPDDPADPTAAPTETPAEPTIAPTNVPVEPTAAPTQEPVLPTVPTDDNTVPPGEAEDPTRTEPTPTEIVLQ